MKKLLSVALCLVLMLSVLPVFALPVSAESSDFEYSISNSEVTIERYIGTGGDVVIPDTIEEYPVRNIDIYAFFYGSNISSITSLSIPESVINIDEDAFDNSKSITNITVNPNNTAYCDVDGVLFNKDKTVLILYPAGKTSTTYIIPDSVTDINGNAFKGCTSLENVTIGDNVETIGYYAFSGCISLTSIVIPNGATGIETYAFSGCTSLSSITIPDSVTSIDNDAFYNTAYYNNSDNWENGALYIGNHLIEYKENATEYTIKEGTITIAYAAFWNSTLTNVTIPDSVKSIEVYAFYSCDLLTSITIPDSVKIIEDRAFEDCTSLENITMGDNIIRIGYGAFYNTAYYNDKTNWVDDYLLYIGNHLVDCDSSVADFIIRDGTKTIAEGICRFSLIKTVTIPNSLANIGGGNFWNTELTDVYYRGSEHDKNSILIGDTNYDLTSATWHYNSCIGAADHTYDDATDTDCNVCGDVREVVHTNGWVLDGANWLYYNSGVKATSWLYVNNTWYYFNADGIMQTGWQQIGYTWYYFGPSGNMLTGWQYINNTWYYFGASGNMLTGWQYLGSSWYYFAEGGNMVTGWQYIGSSWYYFHTGGNMATGWLNLGGTWYYLAEGGNMLTGWQNIGGTWYYFHAGGNMATGWLLLGNTWYYLNEGGAMLTGWHYLGGYWYYFNTSGAWVA